MRSLIGALQAILVPLLLFVVGCKRSEPSRLPTSAAAPAAVSPLAPVKNVILVIGDGMGPSSVGLLMQYAKLAPKSVLPNRTLALESFMQASTTGYMMSWPDGNLVNDSACATTELASGISCRSESLGLDSRGNAIETVLEKAKRSGKSTGLVSDTRLTHATPAAFVSHIAHRSRENEIAKIMVENGADVMLSGGMRHFLPQEVNDPQSSIRSGWSEKFGNHLPPISKRTDNISILELAELRGYHLVFTRTDLMNSKADRLLGLFAASGMPDGIEYSATKNNPGRQIPSLPEMSEKALEILAKNPRGFFLMVEAGQIDWASHRNDAGMLLHEMLKLDETLATILRWAKGREDTLIVLTADHDTGGFGFSYSAFDVPTEIRKGNKFDEYPSRVRYNFCEPELLDRIYAQKRSLFGILQNFANLPEVEQSPERLMEMVNNETSFPISYSEARDVLTSEPNRYFVEAHETLSERYSPLIHDFAAFYPDIEDNRSALIARAVAEEQCVVWSTGSHTTTPVFLIANGPKAWANRFSGMHHIKEVGELLIQSLFGK